MSLVHLTEIKGDRNSDEEINRLSAGSSKKEGKGKEREREREKEKEYTGSRDQQCPHSEASYTRAHY